MITNKIIENELKDLRHDIYDLFLRINQLKNEVHKMNIENNKPIYEQYTYYAGGLSSYKIQSRINKDTIIVNHCTNTKKKHFKFKYPSFYPKDTTIAILSNTRKIIETYIPSQNICLVVEL